MKYFNSTKLMKQLKHVPDFFVVSFCLVLLLTAVSVVFFPGKFIGYGGWLAHRGISNPGYEFYGNNSMVRVYIRKDGSVYLDYTQITNSAESRFWVEDRMENAASDVVALSIDEDVEYGKVVKVLRWLKESNVKNVYLMDRTPLSILDLWKNTQAEKKI